MERLLSLPFFVILFMSHAKNDVRCDRGTFTGTAILLSQQEVDEFVRNCYTKIEGSLLIGTSGNGNNDITNLSGFSPLTEVFPGHLFVRSNVPSSLE